MGNGHEVHANFGSRVETWVSGVVMEYLFGGTCSFIIKIILKNLETEVKIYCIIPPMNFSSCYQRDGEMCFLFGYMKKTPQ